MVSSCFSIWPNNK